MPPAPTSRAVTSRSPSPRTSSPVRAPARGPSAPSRPASPPVARPRPSPPRPSRHPPQQAAPAAPAADLSEHVIVSGETTATIASDHGTTVSDLVGLNDLAQGGALIFAGDVMLVPANGEAQGSYTVQRGDTLAEIAAEHGVDVNALVEANGLDDPNLIIEGQTLSIG
ncbi:MAG: hypothetical protein DI571_14595 [Arsenicicoccus sp.]|nr:MAG: hypothetical protein DI571_14595 [Arsenicicoccus sp.]